jgi:hypothetical protein
VWGDEVLTGDFGYRASSIVEEAVVHAAELLALATAYRQGRESVGAAVFQGGQSVVAVSPDDDRFAEDRDARGFIRLKIL